jgi:hypothetical protein
MLVKEVLEGHIVPWVLDSEQLSDGIVLNSYLLEVALLHRYVEVAA